MIFNKQYSAEEYAKLKTGFRVGYTKRRGKIGSKNVKNFLKPSPIKLYKPSKTKIRSAIIYIIQKTHNTVLTAKIWRIADIARGFRSISKIQWITIHGEIMRNWCMNPQAADTTFIM